MSTLESNIMDTRKEATKEQIAKTESRGNEPFRSISSDGSRRSQMTMAMMTGTATAADICAVPRNNPMSGEILLPMT